MFCLIGWDSPLIFVQFDQPLRIKYTLHIEAFISGRPKVQSIVEGIGVMWLFGSKSCACSTFWVAFDHIHQYQNAFVYFAAFISTLSICPCLWCIYCLQSTNSGQHNQRDLFTVQHAGIW
jgi:uncharacterized membrane protein